MKKLIKKALFTAAAVSGLYIAAQAPRNNHPGLEVLKKYRYAHRGLHDIDKDIPENTMPAFRAAVAHGFGADLEVHVTKDGRLVVIHDSRLERLCGVPLVVEDLTYDELCSYGILGTSERAPLLSEVLEVFEGKTPLIVELKTWKGNHVALCRRTAEMLDAYKGDYCIESFDFRAVEWFRENRPEVVRGQLSEDFVEANYPKDQPVAQFIATHMLTNFRTRPDFVAYRFADRKKLPAAVACKLLEAQEVSWTIRSLEDMLEAEKDGAIVIFEKFIP